MHPVERGARSRSIPEQPTGPISSLPRTLEMALKLCEVRCTVWARPVLAAPEG